MASLIPFRFFIHKSPSQPPTLHHQPLPNSSASYFTGHQLFCGPKSRGLSVVTRGAPGPNTFIFAFVFPFSLLAGTIFTSIRIADRLDQQFLEELAVNESILEAAEDEEDVKLFIEDEAAIPRTRNRPKREAVEPSSSSTINPFHNMKSIAESADKWMFINIQSRSDEYTSNMLNQYTWSNQTLADAVRANFVFWQLYDDTCNGRMVSDFYKIESGPVVMVIDPITGLLMRHWTGMIQASTLMEDLKWFILQSPRNTPDSTFKAVIAELHRKRRTIGYGGGTFFFNRLSI